MKRFITLLAAFCGLTSFVASPAFAATTVSTEAELTAAVAAGGEITLGADIALTERVTIPSDKTIILDLNGKTVTTGDSSGYVLSNTNGSTVTIKDSANAAEVKGVLYNSSTMTIEGGTFTAIGNFALLNASGTVTIKGGTFNGKDSYPIYSYNANHKLTIDDVTINGIFGCLNAYGEGGEVIINGGTFNFTGIEGNTSHIVYVSSGTTMTITGGTFTKTGEVDLSSEGGGGICAMGSAVLNITGGTFTGDYSDVYNWGSTSSVTVSGGTYAHEVSPALITTGSTITVAGKTYTKTESGLVEAFPAYVVLPEGTTVSNYETLFGVNTYPEEQTQNTYSTIAVAANCTGVEINVTGGSITAESQAGCATQWVYGYNANCSIDAVLDTEFSLVGDNAEYLNIDLAASSLSVRAEYADEVEIQGFVTVDTGDGMVSVVAPVAQIGETKYATLAEAIAAAKAGDTIIILADLTLDEALTLPAGIKLNGNGKQITGSILAGGNIEFIGHTKVTSFSVAYTGLAITIGAGACLELTGTERMVIGHGCTFNITGTIADAKTADVAGITPSLIMPGASFTGAGVTFNVNNAYIKAPSSYCSSSKSASDTFDFNITNSIIETAGKLAFESQSVDATVNFELKDSVLTTGSHLVFGVSRGEVVIDNSNVNVGSSRQIENQSTMTIKNGSVVNGAVGTSSNAKNPGTIIVENATYSVTGEFSGADLGTGTIVVKAGANFTAGSVTKANIQIDATGMTAGELSSFTANLSNFAGTLEVINNDSLEASIVDGKIVLSEKPVAKIGDTYYQTLTEAFAAVTSDSQTVTILRDVTEEVTNSSLRGNIVTENDAKVTITLTNTDWVYLPYTFVLGENVTLNVPNGGLFYYAGGSVIKGTVVTACYYQRYANTKLTIEEPGSMTVTTETFIVRYMDGDANAGIYIVGDNDDSTIGLKASVIYFYQGTISATNANIEVGVYRQTNTTDGAGSANLILNNSKMNVTVNEHPMKTDGTSTVTLTNGSNINVSGGYTGVAPSIDASSSITKNDANIFVAKIGNIAYSTIQAAVDAAQVGETVVLLTDIVLDTYIDIPADKDVIIDLNGKTVTAGAAGTYGYALFNGNGGTVTIEDSLDGGEMIGAIENNESTMIIDGGTFTALTKYVIANISGTMTIDGGTFNCTADETYTINSYKGSTSNLAHKLTINNATVNGAFGCLNTYGDNGEVVIENATFNFTGIEGKTSHIVYVSTGTTMTINGGTFTKTGDVDLSGEGGGGICADGTSVVSITGGTFAGANADIYKYSDATIAISGGTFTADPTAYLADGCAALKNFDDKYVVGVAPTATIENLGATIVHKGEYDLYDGSFKPVNNKDMPLPFVMKYVADESAEAGAASPYADWYGDFVITITGIESGSFVADGCYLAGHYGDFGWVKVPIDGLTVENGARYPVMLSALGTGQKYDYICGGVDTFLCALYLTPEILEANQNLKVTLELCVVDNSDGAEAAQNALTTANSPYAYQSAVKEFSANEFEVSAVAQVDDKDYATLDAAIDAAKAANTTVTILDPEAISENEPLVVAKTGGQTIEGQKAAEAAKVLGGAFTVVDDKLVYAYELGVQAVTFTADKFVMTIGLTEGEDNAKVTREFTTDRWVVVFVGETKVYSRELTEIGTDTAKVEVDKDTILGAAPPSGSTTKRISFKITDEEP